MQSIVSHSEIQKIVFQKSLILLNEHLDDLVNHFYRYFLSTKAAELFNLFDMEKQYRMFRVSIAILISHVDNPFMLDKHLRLVVEKHKHYGVTKEHTKLFLNSFNKALKDIFQDHDEFTRIWSNIMNEIMLSFDNQMDKRKGD